MHRTSTGVLLIVAALVLFLVPVAAIAAGGFDDVDDDNIFKADIQWLADAGVTKGCNPPANTEFCPGSNVTREQMAAFMHRLAANKVVDAATALDADKLDGIDSDAFLPNGTPPVGTTARGNYGLGGGSDSWGWTDISWGFEMPSVPEVHWLPAGSASTADCPGTPANPQAAEGHLCVYEKGILNVGFRDIVSGGTTDPDTADVFGAILHAQQATSSEWTSYGTWAITVGTP
jgi:hypothetical protein